MLALVAHRTRLALGEKGLDFELIEIDLQNRPTWFSEVSVYGKVPALEHAGQRFVESAIINEYLEETFPTPALLPPDPAKRALARFWIDFANTRFVPAWGKLLRAQDRATAAQSAGELIDAVQVLERGLKELSGAGPYWFGAEPSLRLDDLPVVRALARARALPRRAGAEHACPARSLAKRAA